MRIKRNQQTHPKRHHVREHISNLIVQLTYPSTSPLPPISKSTSYNVSSPDLSTLSQLFSEKALSSSLAGRDRRNRGNGTELSSSSSVFPPPFVRQEPGATPADEAEGSESSASSSCASIRHMPSWPPALGARLRNDGDLRC